MTVFSQTHVKIGDKEEHKNFKHFSFDQDGTMNKNRAKGGILTPVKGSILLLDKKKCALRST